MSLRVGTIALAAAALAAALVTPTSALGDGDPASDVLLAQSVYYPYHPPVSSSLSHWLEQLTAAAARAKFPIKVALIETPVDLGVIPDLFGKPQQYAAFLDQEISLRQKQPLLVVMPAGFGAQGLPASATTAVSALPKPASGQSDALARAAIDAVGKLAAASGHPLKGAPGADGASTGSGSSTTWILVALVVAALATAAALIAVRRRPASSPPD
jgi:hypothetical protein